MTAMILIDLQKEFDTFDHDVLLKQTSVTGFSNQVIDLFQSWGFRKNHSTSSCLPCLHEKCFKDFDTRLMTGVILVDLQKTFDTIDHDIPLKQMSVIGFSNHAIDSFQSYLSNQLFRISLEKIHSKSSSITCGLQGSILGRLLFLIYVNDVPQVVKSNLFHMLTTLALSFKERVSKKSKSDWIQKIL